MGHYGNNSDVYRRIIEIPYPDSWGWDVVHKTDVRVKQKILVSYLRDELLKINRG